jgi:hypothetical protein
MRHSRCAVGVPRVQYANTTSSILQSFEAQARGSKERAGGVQPSRQLSPPADNRSPRGELPLRAADDGRVPEANGCGRLARGPRCSRRLAGALLGSGRMGRRCPARRADARARRRRPRVGFRRRGAGSDCSRRAWFPADREQEPPVRSGCLDAKTSFHARRFGPDGRSSPGRPADMALELVGGASARGPAARWDRSRRRIRGRQDRRSPRAVPLGGTPGRKPARLRAERRRPARRGQAVCSVRPFRAA